MRWITLARPYERVHAEEFVAMGRRNRRSGRGAHFLITTPDRDEALGAVGLGSINREQRRAVIGYWLVPSAWGRGYAREGLAAIVQLARRERLHKLVAHTFDGNQPSERLLEASGFELEGTLKRHMKHRGRWRDLLVWGRFPSARR